MGKFYYYYGTMGAGKTALAICKAYEFTERKKKVYIYLPEKVWKPNLESRNGTKLPVNKDLLGDEHLQMIEDNSVVIVDEAQFLTEKAVHELKKLSTFHNVLVFCYGLLTDFKTRMFEGAKYALEMADTIREIPCMCSMCDTKSQFNYRLSFEKELVVLSKDKYKALCAKCFWTCA